MAATENRTPEQVTREIEQEREQLATAVMRLRGELNAKRLVQANAGKIALVGVALVGLKVGMMVMRRRRHEQAIEAIFGTEVLSFGRFTLWARD